MNGINLLFGVCVLLQWWKKSIEFFVYIYLTVSHREVFFNYYFFFQNDQNPIAMAPL